MLLGNKGTKKQTVVDCSQLKEGMVVKNYKELCNLLNETVLAGDSKKAQVERWKCYFDFDRQGVKYIINEIFDEPYPSLDARKNREGIYVGYIELLLMDYLSNKKNYTAYLTKRQLYNLLGMTSCTYSEKRDKVKEIIDDVNNDNQTQIYKSDVKEFYSRADLKLNSIINSALKSMKNKFLIEYSTEYVICFDEDNKSIIDCNSPTGYKVEHKTKIANNYEIQQILDAQNIVANDMGYPTMSSVIIAGKTQAYFKALNDFVKTHFNWNGVYSRLKIIYLSEAIKEKMPMVINKIQRLSRNDKRLCLNTEVVNALNRQAENKYAAYEKELPHYHRLSEEEFRENFGGNLDDAIKELPVEKEEPPKYSINYVEIQKRLADYLIKL